jgi:hypothetical protein
MDQGRVHLKVLDPETGDEELIKSWAGELSGGGQRSLPRWQACRDSDTEMKARRHFIGTNSLLLKG